MGGHEENSNDPGVSYPNVDNRRSPFAATASSSLYPEIHNNDSEPGNGSAPDAAAGAFEERLVTIPGAMVHLVDEHESVLLGSGDFSVVRINQGDEQGIVALVRVGDGLQWPLMSDEQVVKLGPIHYVFSIPAVDSATAPEVRIYTQSSSIVRLICAQPDSYVNRKQFCCRISKDLNLMCHRPWPVLGVLINCTYLHHVSGNLWSSCDYLESYLS